MLETDEVVENFGDQINSNHPDKVETLPMFEEDLTAAFESLRLKDQESPSKQYLQTWKIVEVEGKPVLVKRQSTMTFEEKLNEAADAKKEEEKSEEKIQEKAKEAEKSEEKIQEKPKEAEKSEEKIQEKPKEAEKREEKIQEKPKDSKKSVEKI